MNVNYYYAPELSSDDESCLVQLCRECAADYRLQIQWAAAGDEESVCEFCEAANDPEGREWMRER